MNAEPTLRTTNYAGDILNADPQPLDACDVIDPTSRSSSYLLAQVQMVTNKKPFSSLHCKLISSVVMLKVAVISNFNILSVIPRNLKIMIFG